MFIIGITGGSGTGKSTVCDILKSYGIDVIDADIIARKIVEKNQPALEEIKNYFGQEYILSDGTLNRKKLGAIVFTDSRKLKILNEITHKYISEYVKAYIKNTKNKVIAIDAPLLFESGLNSECDYILSVLSNEKNRIKRITARDGISEKSARERINSQKNNTFYIENSDCLIYNNSSYNDLKEQVDEILKKLGDIIKWIKS